MKFREVDNDEQVLLVEKVDLKLTPALRLNCLWGSYATEVRLYSPCHRPAGVSGRYFALIRRVSWFDRIGALRQRLTLEAVSEILALATLLEREDPILRAQRLAKRRIALLFYESSTRTRTSFELAAKGLGADTTLVSSLSSSIEKGETLKDTGLTLRALGAEAIILRHPSSGRSVAAGARNPIAGIECRGRDA